MEKIYQNISVANNFSPDESQLELIRILQVYKDRIDQPSGGVLTKLFKSKAKNTTCGMYIWGDVGRGKSLIINMFFDALESKQKLRTHFHGFMIGIHKQLSEMRKSEANGANKKSDYIKKLANDLARQYKVICFDELQINNIADAMIVGRLFRTLSQLGVLTFFSSNFHPSELYVNGLQRERFLPFVDHVLENLEVYNLNNHRDYRLDKLGKLETAYLTPLSMENQVKLDEIVFDLTGHTKLHETTLTIDDNRFLRCLNTYGKIAVFSFSELCEIPMGAIDYFAICANFSTVIIKNIPKLTEDNYNEALRFITLIDCLYENKTRLICTAATTPELLYESGKFAFEFKRTASRLKEMQSAEYLKPGNEVAA